MKCCQNRDMACVRLGCVERPGPAAVSGSIIRTPVECETEAESPALLDWRFGRSNRKTRRAWLNWEVGAVREIRQRYLIGGETGVSRPPIPGFLGWAGHSCPAGEDARSLRCHDHGEARHWDPPAADHPEVACV